ncbi:MAG: hypothetical protein Fur0025_23740 [Oscillatoriaceae cyanobacterium]
MVQVNFNIWGEKRIVASTPSSIGADGSVVIGAPKPVFKPDMENSRNIVTGQKTYILIHGFNNSGGNEKNNYKSEVWASTQADALREKDPNANIIIVDWEDGAILKNNLPFEIGGNYPNYPDAANNTKEVGRQIAKYLEENQINPDNTELIGHSLGAHAAGYAGDTYKQKTGKQIARITALDPAQFSVIPDNLIPDNLIPGIRESSFTDPFSGRFFSGQLTFAPGIDLPVGWEPAPPSDRLDPDDAQRVVVLHSSKILGTDQNFGDLDVFLNWDNWSQGYSQPGTGIGIINLNHGYAPQLYTDLIKGNIFPQNSSEQFNQDYLTSKTGQIQIDTTRALFTGSTSGFFGSSGFWGNGSNKLSLGTPGNSESFVTFDGNNFLTGENILFPIGEMTYQNGQTVSGTGPFGDFPLNIELSLTKPLEYEQYFTFLLNNQVTDNTTGDPVLDGDRLLFSEQVSRERFTYQGKEYTVDLFGFSKDGGQNVVGQFDSPEDSTATADLYAKIVPVSFFGLATSVAELGDDFGNNVRETVDGIKNTYNDAVNGILRGLYFILPSNSPRPRMALNDGDTQAVASGGFQMTADLMAENPGGVIGSENNDQIIGSEVTDVVFASGGADNVDGGMSNDYLRGGKDNDRLLGGDSNDILNGNEGDDFISGGPGNDLVRGGQGNDEIFGDDGNDILIAERGTDILTGGTGADIFILRSDTGEEETNSATADWILDFNPNEGDRIGINEGIPTDILTLTPADVNQDGTADTIIQYTENNDIIGLYTNIFGVAINTTPEIVQTALFTLPLNDSIMDFG